MRRLVIVFSLLATPALAQQSPLEQALGAKLMREINEGMVCSTQLLTAQQQLAAAQARVKTLEAEQAKPKD